MYLSEVFGGFWSSSRERFSSWRLSILLPLTVLPLNLSPMLADHRSPSRTPTAKKHSKLHPTMRVQERKKSTNPNFRVPDIFGGVGVFHAKGWGPKSSACPSKPGKSNFFGGISHDFAGISRRCPKSLRRKSLCSICGAYECALTLKLLPLSSLRQVALALFPGTSIGCCSVIRFARLQLMALGPRVESVFNL